MIFGALVASSQDLAFSLPGYTYVMLNNFLTASNGVYLKKKLDAKDLGKNGLLFYNSLFMLPLAFVVAWCTGDLQVVIYLPFFLHFYISYVNLYFWAVVHRLGNTSTGMTYGFCCNSWGPALWDLSFRIVHFCVHSTTLP